MASLPSLFETGILSPVSMASFTLPLPDITSPSRGIRAPGFTNITSPTFTLDVGASLCLSPSIKTAVSGASSISLAIASLVFSLLLVSMYLPAETKVITTAVGLIVQVVDKMWIISNKKRLTRLYIKDAVALKATNVSILGLPQKSDVKPLIKKFLPMKSAGIAKIICRIAKFTG